MKRTILLACAVAIAGCSTPTMPEMRSAGPSQTLESRKSEDEYAKCLLFAWQDMRLAGELNKASIQPGRNGGTTVLARDGGFFADISAVQGRTLVKYYEASDTWISKRLREPVKKCL